MVFNTSENLFFETYAKSADKVQKKAEVAQWVKPWPADLMVLRGENLFNHKQSYIAYSLSLSLSHCSDMTEILLKRR